MASTTFRGNTIQVTHPNAAADWTLASASAALNELEPGPPIRHIMYTPGASADVVVIKDRDDAGPVKCRFESESATNQRIVYFNGARFKPYIDISEGTYGKTANSFVTIELE